MDGSAEQAPGATGGRNRIAAATGFAAIALLGLALHWEFAKAKTAGLLEHDESISLLAAAGKSDRMAALNATPDRVRIMAASELQALLRPTGDTGFADVWRSVVNYDVHPPLYFWLLHGLERVGITSLRLLRLIGFAALLAAAIVADRWIWPTASPWARLPAFGMLIAAPVFVDLATELRQYAIVWLGIVLTIAALAKLDRGGNRGSAIVVLGIAGVLLVWTHLGSVAWVAIALLVAIWLASRDDRRRAWPLLATGLAIGALVMPLALANWNPVAVGRAEASEISLTAAIEFGARMSRSIAETFIWQPVRTDGSTMVVALTGTRLDEWLPRGVVVLTPLLLAIAAVWLAAASGRFEKALLVGGGVWSLAWLAGLSLGKIPEHATAPKYLAPMTLALMAIVVRATDSKLNMRRRAAIGILLISLATAPIGWTVRLPSTGVAQGREIDPIRAAQALLVDRPKRGQVLPIAEKLSPGATVIIAEPEAAMANWKDVEAALPKERLVVLEIDAERAPPEAKTARTAVFEKLRALYGDEHEFRRGSSRTMTEFRSRRDDARN